MADPLGVMRVEAITVNLDTVGEGEGTEGEGTEGEGFGELSQFMSAL